MKKKLHVVILAAAVLAIAGGVSYAAIPAADGTISACRDAQGRLKVIDTEAGQSCPSNQQLLTWNQQGPAGTPGIAGRQVVTAESTIDSSQLKEVYVECPAGKLPLGGGAKALYWTSSGEFLLTELAVAHSAPTYDGWGAWAHEVVATSQPWMLRTYVICAYIA